MNELANTSQCSIEIEEERLPVRDEVRGFCDVLGLDPLYIEEMPSSRHIFSHIEWRMEAYRIRVSSLEKAKDKDLIFADKEQTGKRYAIPSAFGAYARYIKEEKR